MVTRCCNANQQLFKSFGLGRYCQIFFAQVSCQWKQGMKTHASSENQNAYLIISEQKENGSG